jgi:hypothetical protein
LHSMNSLEVSLAHAAESVELVQMYRLCAWTPTAPE